MWLKSRLRISAVFSVLAALPRAAQSQNEQTGTVTQPLTAGKNVTVKQQEDLGNNFRRDWFPRATGLGWLLGNSLGQ
jgi:hypothetical protein